MTSSPHLSGFNSTFPGVQYFHPALTPFAICISVSSQLLAWQQIMSCLLILPNEHPTQSPNPILYNASGTSENWLCITSVCGDTATCDFKKRSGHSQVCKHNVMTHNGILFHTFHNVCYHPPDQWPFVWEQMTPSQCSTVQTYHCLLFSEDWRSHCVLQSLHIFLKFNQICRCRSIHIRCYCWRVECQMN